MRPGIYERMPAAQYHATDAISKTGLDVLNRSPAHYFAQYLDPNRVKPEQTEAQLTGTATHSAILEPDTFDELYAIVPANAPRRPSSTQMTAKNPSADTIAAIHWWRDFEAEIAGKTLITADLRDLCMRMRDSVRSQPAAAYLLNKGRAETSFFATDPETGVLVRVRPDWIGDIGVMADIKTTEDARPEPFTRDCYKFRYYVQSALYPDVVSWTPDAPKIDGFVMIAVEKKPPFACVVYEPDSTLRSVGREAYRRDLDTFASCKKSGQWPAYPTEVQSISLPGWVKI